MTGDGPLAIASRAKLCVDPKKTRAKFLSKQNPPKRTAVNSNKLFVRTPFIMDFLPLP